MARTLSWSPALPPGSLVRMEKEVFEVVLKNSFNDSKIKRIIEIKSEPALPKGENYASTILRITAKVVLGNGRTATKSFIGKKENTGEAASQIRNDLGLFNLEISVYTNILREMDYLMEEFGDTEGPLWCQFIHYHQSDSTIILENLKASGFTTVNRTEGQNLDQARLVLRSLGRFHAMAKVLEDRGLLSKDDYKPYPMIHDDVYIRNTSYGGIQALIKGMREGWGEEWAEYANKLSKVRFQEYSKMVKESGNFDDNTFKCLNHGDCWNNNMMFKNNWEGRPIELRFVDFQLPHYNSPCVDVTYFLYTSIKPSIRHQNYKSLVELYHESLTSSLDRFGYNGPKPSLEEINNSMERLKFFGLTFFMACIPVVVTTRTDALDLDLIYKTNGEEGFNIRVYYEDGIIEKMGEDLKALVNVIES
ncbi:uncharacterized protein [Halyomorpha halys]|uniref:uncharacterized protein isoform X2 n=1 Tax=Halyomorpha halys TaxID=286706 RepID=UPI0034D34EB2